MLLMGPLPSTEFHVANSTSPHQLKFSIIYYIIQSGPNILPNTSLWNWNKHSLYDPKFRTAPLIFSKLSAPHLWAPIEAFSRYRRNFHGY